MECCCETNASANRSRLSQSSYARGCLVQGRSFHDPGVGYSAEPAAASLAAVTPGADPDLAPSDLPDDRITALAGQGSTSEGNVAVLGVPQAIADPPLYPRGRQAPARSLTKTPGSRIVTRNVLSLLETQQYRCALSGRELEPDTAALDHIVPVCRGGAHEIGNAQVLHKQVNRAKGTMTNDEFIQLCREVLINMAEKDPKHMEVQT